VSEDPVANLEAGLPAFLDIKFRVNPAEDAAIANFHGGSREAFERMDHARKSV